jgi:hypothetical protein
MSMISSMRTDHQRKLSPQPLSTSGQRDQTPLAEVHAFRLPIISFSIQVKVFLDYSSFIIITAMTLICYL